MKGRLLGLVMLLALSIMLTACGNDNNASNNRKVVVASKDFTEAIVIGEMYS